MITIPSAGVLVVATASIVVLMTCQWIIGGAWLRNRRAQSPQDGPPESEARAEFSQAA